MLPEYPLFRRCERNGDDDPFREADKMQFCVRKSWRYECFDGEWHRSG